MDYHEAETLFRDAYRGRRSSGHLAGANLMTPDVLGFVTIDGAAVEVSTGTGFDGERIWGLTWPRVDGRPDPRDRVCFSWAEVVDALG